MISDAAIAVGIQGQPPVMTTVKVRQLSAEQRGGRAFKRAGILAAIGLGSVFIPIVHFFLPWIMLTAAIVVYVRTRNEGAMLLASTVACPSCESAIELPEQSANWPIEWNCHSCRKRLTLKLAVPAGAPTD